MSTQFNRQGAVPTSRRQFTYGHLEVEELIFAKWDGEEDKLLWCLVPFEKTLVNDVLNPCSHIDFEQDTAIGAETIARRRVQQGFDKHHGVNLTALQVRDVLQLLER